MAKRKPQPNGRPPAMTPETIAKLEEAFALGCTDREACLWADIATATLYKWQVKNPDFTERKAQLKETPILKARQSVIGALKDDPKLALAYLERRAKSEFSLRTETDITSGGEPLKALVEFMDNNSGDNKDTSS